MFKTSESTIKLDEAMAKVQAEITPALKDKTNPFFKSKYADLPAVWEACRKTLTKNGVSVTQWPVHSDDGKLHMVTRLACGGEWMLATLSFPVVKQDPQGYVSATTYARRAALSAAVGIVSDEDDDGNAGSGRRHEEPEEFKQQAAHIRETARPVQKPNNQESATMLLGMLIGKDKPFSTKVVDAKRWMEEVVKKDFDKIDSKDCEEIKKAIEAKFK